MAADLLAQAAHVDLDQVAVAVGLLVVDVLRERRLRQDPPGVEHHVPEHPELGAGQRARLAAVEHHLLAVLVEGQRRRADARGHLPVAAVDQGADARDELLDVEGLAEVVVAAGVEAVDALVPGVARGQHDHRHGVAARAPGAQHLEPGALGQPEVEHHGVVGLGVAEVLGVDAVRRAVDREARAHEVRAHEARELVVVLREEQSHGRIRPVGVGGGPGRSVDRHGRSS